MSNASQSCIDKAALRQTARRNLKANLPQRSEKSNAVWQTLMKRTDVLEAQHSGSLMLYLDFGEEVETIRFLQHSSFAPDGGFIVPICLNGNILPVRIFSMDETEPGVFGIPEPRSEIVNNPQRLVVPEDIRLVLVPGLAFDRRGNRLGRGKGYYDRFLCKLSMSAITIGLAFECQVFDCVPMDTGDCPVATLITENG